MIRLSEIFDITVDELLKNEKLCEPKVLALDEKTDHSITISYLEALLEDPLFNAHKCGLYRYELLWKLVEQIKSKYVDISGHTREPYLLCNTTAKERRISLYPFTVTESESLEYTLAEEHIKGSCEINEFFDRIQAEYVKRRDNSFELQETKRESVLTDKYHTIFNATRVVAKNELGELILNMCLEKMRNILEGNHTDSLIDRLLLFFAKEVDLAIQSNDDALLSEISSDLQMLKNYVWHKIPAEKNI